MLLCALKVANACGLYKDLQQHMKEVLATPVMRCEHFTHHIRRLDPTTIFYHTLAAGSKRGLVCGGCAPELIGIVCQHCLLLFCLDTHSFETPMKKSDTQCNVEPRAAGIDRLNPENSIERSAIIAAPFWSK